MNIQKRSDITNRRFGKLVVVAFCDRGRNGHYRWTCQCDCGRQTTVFATHLHKGNSKSCGVCSRTSGPSDKRWAGCGDLPLIKWYAIVRGATKSKTRRAIDFQITIDDAWAQFLKQDGKCALTGTELWFGPSNSKQHEGNASLDRIDSGLGYTKENIQWVHKDINLMKNKLSQRRFIELCNMVGQHVK